MKAIEAGDYIKRKRMSDNRIDAIPFYLIDTLLSDSADGAAQEDLRRRESNLIVT